MLSDIMEVINRRGVCMPRIAKQQSGFTILELLIVIVAVGILTALVIFLFTS